MRPTDYPSIKIYRVATLKLNVLLGSMLMGGAMPVYALLFGEVLGILSLETEEARTQSVFYSGMFLGMKIRKFSKCSL